MSTVICKNLVSAKVNKIELDIGLECSDYAASIGAIIISVPSFKTEIFNSKKPNISTRLNDLSKQFSGVFLGLSSLALTRFL